MADRYFDDFAVGDSFETSELTISESDVTDFCKRFDPQPWHLDREAAARSPFKSIVTSGWHTTALTMRLLVDSGELRATGILGTGVDDLRWLAPVRPGDTLRVHAEVVAKIAPEPGHSTGRLQVRLTTRNQHGEAVLSETPTLLVPRRR